MTQKKSTKARIYTRYPRSSILLYDGTTIAHYILGGIGIMLGYNFSWVALLFGALYIIFSLSQMYVMMPLTVCPNCVYYRIDDSLCISGMNVVSRKIAKQGNLENFAKRGQGLFCHNNLYMAPVYSHHRRNPGAGTEFFICTASHIPGRAWPAYFPLFRAVSKNCLYPLCRERSVPQRSGYGSGRDITTPGGFQNAGYR